MPSVINANTSGGLISTADTSGILQLQTASTTALTISAAQVVTISKDAIIDGLTVGQGAGNVATNTAVGASGLNANTTGAFNTAIGAQALQANTTASNNTAVGFQSLSSATTGQYNTAIGEGSLRVNTTSSYNTTLGWRSGYGLTGGNGWNTFLGYNSGVGVTTGDSNTIVGGYAGVSLTTGNGNTFIGSGSGGYGSGYLVTTGNNNTILGVYSGNQDGFDIRTASNYVVISGGDGQRVLTAARGSSLALNNATPQFGTGITFPATQSASSDANTLDDYEEGTWTPGITNATSYTTRLARYTKIGNLVYAYCNVACTFNNTGGTAQLITGLPFAVESVSNDLYPLGNIFQVQGWNQSPMLLATQGTPNSTTCTLYTISQSTGNNYQSVTPNTFGTSVVFEMSIVYRAA